MQVLDKRLSKRIDKFPIMDIILYGFKFGHRKVCVGENVRHKSGTPWTSDLQFFLFAHPLI